MDDDLDLEEETNLPDGTYPISLTQATQERFDCVIDWDLSPLEPHKVIMMEKVLNELDELGEGSDFFPLKHQIRKSILEELLLILDPAEQYGANFLICLNGESKYVYLQIEEDKNMQLVDDYEAIPYQYIPPVAKKWDNLESDLEIQKLLVTDTRPKIRLQIKNSQPRKDVSVVFEDRNVDDVGDGYVACESQYDPRQFRNVESMEHAMQAVPVLVDGSSQTELKHPKNVFTQYEPRVFTEEEVEVISKSKEMEGFLHKVVDIVNEVLEEPDIMGDLRDAVETFYKRDHVEIIEETQLKEMTFLTDINFTHQMRVSHIRWHPTIPGVIAMSVLENKDFETYLERLTTRIVMTNMLLIWSVAHPLFPQLLLRICDDVTKFEWHPTEENILVGGCINGQVVIWDIGEYVPKLSSQISIYDHDIVMEKQTDKLHIQDGFIPVLYWSAESNINFSHKLPIEDLQWLPANVWFSHESAYPKTNQNEKNRQFVTCSSDSYILVWDFRRPPSDTGIIIDDDEVGDSKKRGEEEGGDEQKKKRKLWEKLRNQTQRIIEKTSYGKSKYWTPAVGKYSFLNKIWKPVHKICFVEKKSSFTGQGGQQMPAHMHQSSAPQPDPPLKELITSLSVTDRPDLMIFRKGSEGGAEGRQLAKMRKKLKEKKDRDDGSVGSLDGDDDSSISSKDRGSVSSVTQGKREGSLSEGRSLMSSGDDDEDDEPDPTQIALPTLLMAGTIFGNIFRADLSKNKVDVETNNLICMIEWRTTVHDGPVKLMAKCPFMPHLLLSVGGYSFAVWNEGVMSKPVLQHFVNQEQFTSAAWSLTQPSIIYFSGEKGNLQVWDITKRRSEPIQVQNIAGSPINAICPYNMTERNGEASENYYISIADDTGVLRLMQLPKHLWMSSDQALDNLQLYIDGEIAKKAEKERLQKDRPTQSGKKKRTWEEDMQDETEVDETEEDFLRFYFVRERVITERIFGGEWRRHLKNPQWQSRRDQYQIPEVRPSAGSSSPTSSMSDERRSEVLLGMKAKTKGMLQFLNMAKVRAELREGGTSSEDETQKITEIEEDEDV